MCMKWHGTKKCTSKFLYSWEVKNSKMAVKIIRSMFADKRGMDEFLKLETTDLIKLVEALSFIECTEIV